MYTLSHSITRRDLARTSAATAATLGAIRMMPSVAFAQDAMGTPPAGDPPTGAPPSGGAPGGGSSEPTIDPIAGEEGSQSYKLDGGTETLSNQDFVATADNESGVFVTNAGSLTLTDSTVTKTGDTTSADESSFFGLNAAVLVNAGSTMSTTGLSIDAEGEGANGIIVTGEGSTLDGTNVKIVAKGGGAHGIMCTQGGIATLTDPVMDTVGDHAAPLATDRGSGTLTVSGGTFTSNGDGSPSIYSTGAITVDGGTFTVTGSEAMVIEGTNTIDVTNCSFTAEGLGRGAMLYQSMSGDSEGTESKITMTGGSFAYNQADGEMFFVTNATGEVVLNGVKLTNAGPTFFRAAADQWGNEGQNGGHAIVNADGQEIVGDVVVDDVSDAVITLANGSSLTGALNAAASAGTVSLTLDASSTLTLTADSVVSALAGVVISGESVSNIVGNGFNLTYDSTASADLDGATYTLSGGGSLAPA